MPCAWCRIDLCPFSRNDHDSYLKNLSIIKRFLSGNYTKIIKNLQKKMIALSKKEEFEEAAKLRNQIQKLKNIISHKSVVTTQDEPRAEIVKKLWQQTFGFKFLKELKHMIFPIFRAYWRPVQWWYCATEN